MPDFAFRSPPQAIDAGVHASLPAVDQAEQMLEQRQVRLAPQPRFRDGASAAKVAALKRGLRLGKDLRPPTILVTIAEPLCPRQQHRQNRFSCLS